MSKFALTWGVLFVAGVAAGCNQGTVDSTDAETDLDTGADAGTDTSTTTGDESCAETVVTLPEFQSADGDHPYQACAEATAVGTSPVISDFEGCAIRVLQNEGRDGLWFTYDDGTDGTVGMNVQSGALHVTSSGWTGFGAGVGLTIGPSRSDTEHCCYDAAVYAGIRFRARGKGSFRTMLVTVDNLPLEMGGACDRPGDDCYNWPGEITSLTGDWQTFELPFCELTPEVGWGGEVAPVNPKQIAQIQFRLPAGLNIELWMDDLEFMTAENATEEMACCPMDMVPYPDTIQPETSDLALTDELTLHTFEQQTVGCGAVTRRYLSFVPSSVPASSDAPILIALHGSGANAETFQDFYAHGRLDALAAQHGAVIVYGNAAPGAFSSTDPKLTNTGSWRQDYMNDGKVDDVAYLESVLKDLESRGVVSGSNDRYLIGLSNGGGMVLKAVSERPALWRGFASFMAYAGLDPPQPPSLEGTDLTRILYAYSSADPGLPSDYLETQLGIAEDWAAALGLPADVIANPATVPLPDPVIEGELYAGSNDVALSTRGSSVTELDMVDASVPGTARILRFEGAGHLWPNPVADTDEWINETFGFRNQDLDAADAVFDFFFD